MVSCSGSLVQSRCGEGGALQTRVTDVCGEHSQCSGHNGFAPTHGVCAFPVYTAQAPGCFIGGGPCVACTSSFRVLHKSTDSVGPAFCAFPTGAVLAARSLMSALSLGVVRLIPPRSQPQFLCVSIGCALSVLGSWSLDATLPVRVNHPESQEVFG